LYLFERYLINFVSEKDYSNSQTWKGLFYVFLLFGTLTIYTLLIQHGSLVMYRLGLNIGSVLTCAILSKTLNLSNKAKKGMNKWSRIGYIEFQYVYKKIYAFQNWIQTLEICLTSWALTSKTWWTWFHSFICSGVFHFRYLGLFYSCGTFWTAPRALPVWLWWFF